MRVNAYPTMEMLTRSPISGNATTFQEGQVPPRDQRGAGSGEAIARGSDGGASGTHTLLVTLVNDVDAS